MPDEQTDRCEVCRRREPADGLVCTPCRTGLSGHLDRLLSRLAELPLHLAPATVPPGERVTTSRTGSPASARIDVLSLLAHGGHGQIRRDPDTGESILVTDEDQVGVTPPGEWLGQQVATWRAAFGHSRPAVTLKAKPQPQAEERLRDDMIARMACLSPELAGQAWVGRLLVDMYHHGRAQLITGMSPGNGGDRPATSREEDPLADEWGIRFGEPATPREPARNVQYLKTWLDAACRRHDLDLHRFAAELRALNAELGRALGERVDAEYLGLCPTAVTDRTTSASTWCGASLWQDPYASVVTCPRCRATHGPRITDLIRLAQQIRRVWPLDRRRRYSLDDRTNLPEVPCPTCAQSVYVYWRDVTGTEDAWTPWFVPIGVMCPGGCASALDVLR